MNLEDLSRESLQKIRVVEFATDFSPESVRESNDLEC